MCNIYTHVLSTKRRFTTIMIHLNLSHFVDGQIDSEILDNISENDTISLTGGESDIDPLGTDLGLDLHENMYTKKPYSILDKLMASPLNNIKHQYTTNTATSTTSSIISHPLSTITTATTHSTITTTNSTPTTNYSNTQHNTTPTQTPITTKTKKSPTTHILKMLRHQPTATTPSTSITPPLRTSYNKYPLPINPNLLSTTTSKSKINPPIHNPNTYHSPSTSSPIAPTTSQPSKPQPHNTFNQPSKTTLPPAPSPKIFQKILLPGLTNQTLTIHRNTHTYLHHQLTIIHLNTARLHPLPKLQPTNHTTYHLNQLIKSTRILNTKLHLL